MSEFLRRSLMIFIITGFQTIVFIFIVISTTFRPICPSAFFRCFLSNSGTYTELRTTSFTESTGVACSDSVSHNVKYSCIVTRQQNTLRNGYRRWFPKLLRRQSSGGCRFKPDCRKDELSLLNPLSVFSLSTFPFTFFIYIYIYIWPARCFKYLFVWWLHRRKIGCHQALFSLYPR